MDAFTIFFKIVFIVIGALLAYGIFVFLPLKLYKIMATQLDLSAKFITAATDLDTIKTSVQTLLTVAAGSDQVSPELQADADIVLGKIADLKAILAIPTA